MRPEEWGEAGRETRAGFAALLSRSDPEYLEVVADVAERSGRTTVLVALEKGRILGSVTAQAHR